jgi:hypothetical protein
MTDPEQAIRRYASSHYGHLILVDNPLYYEDEGLYISNLRSDYPFKIKDDKPPQRKSLHVLKIDNLGSIVLDSNGRIIKDRTTSRAECLRNLDLFFKMWKKRAEEIVVSASADELVKISRFNHFFDMIDEILSSLWDYRHVDDQEINFDRSRPRRKRMRLYLGLLEGLQVLRKAENGYDEGNLTTMLRNEYKTNEDGFRDAVISTIFRERYPALRDVFKLTIFEPTIHIDNCIYLPEIEIEEPIYRVTDSIERDYFQYYQRTINPMVLNLILKRLLSVKAIDRDGKHYFGSDRLRKEMVRLKKESPPINRELIVKA